MTATIDAPILPSPRPPAYPPVVVRRLPPLDPEPAAAPIAGLSAAPIAEPAAAPIAGSSAAPIAEPAAAPIAEPAEGPALDTRPSTGTRPAPGTPPAPDTPPTPSTRPAPAPARPSVPGNPRVEIERVLRLLMEMLDGRRPATQAGGRIGPMALRYLVAARTRLHPAGRRVGTAARHGPPGLKSFRMSHPAENVTEASARWVYRGRSRALAARFEWRAERWRCTVLRLG